MKKGFTLIEILVCIAILSLVIAGIYGILNVGNMTYNEDMGLVDLQQPTRQTMDGMIREIRQSGRPLYNIAIDNDGKGITFSTPDTPSIRYYLDTNSRQIIRQQPAGTGQTRILANNINGLSFCWWDGIDCCDVVLEDCSSLHILQIQLNAVKTVGQRTLIFPQIGPLTEKVRLRNE